MELKRTYMERSPQASTHVRLCGEVTYDDGKCAPETYWFDIPEKYAEYVSTSGNPWVACLLPLAVTLGEPLRLCRPIDRLLFENASDLVDIWTCWHPHLTVIPIEADLVNPDAQQQGLKTMAAFFSGGVDSFFTALRNQEGSIRSTPIDDLLHVWGLDIPLKQEDAYRRMVSRLRVAASALGKELIEISTNLRTTRLDKTGWDRWDGWGALYHASALASVGLALEKRYGKILINSAFSYRYLHPWGSHPLTDPLMTTSQTRIVHYGAASGRIQKIEYLTKHDVALQNLHVCPKLGTDTSCGNCRKCYYTMTTLLLLGALDRCPTFSKINFDIRKVEHIYSADDCDRAGLKALQTLALQRGRPDIAKAIDRSFTNTDRVDRWLPTASWLGQKLSRARFPWRYAYLPVKIVSGTALT
jgi:hypothetical protein